MLDIIQCPEGWQKTGLFMALAWSIGILAALGNACGLYAEESPDILPLESGLKTSLRGICAVDDTTVWVSGSLGQYALTSSGGAAWNVSAVPGADSLDFRDVHAWDSRSAVLMAAGPGARSGMFLTSDGGSTWEQTYSMPHETGFLCAIDFWNRNDGIALSDPVQGHFLILRTRDGGRTWQEMSKHPALAAAGGEYAFAASGTCLIVQDTGHVWIGSGGSAARVYRSRNGGAIWSSAATPMRQGSPSSGIFSLAFYDTLRGIAVGGDYQQPDAQGGNLMITADGGGAWRLTDAAGFGYHSTVVVAHDGTRGIALASGPSATHLSSDHGLTWRAAPAGYHTADIAPGRRTIWLAGSDGSVGILPHSNEPVYFER